MSAPHCERERAIEELAKTLVAEMERLDPTEDWDPCLSRESNWRELDERRKTFYRLCVKVLLTEENWMRIALGG
jgi:hypothetical protein